MATNTTALLTAGEVRDALPADATVSTRDNGLNGGDRIIEGPPAEFWAKIRKWARR